MEKIRVREFKIVEITQIHSFIAITTLIRMNVFYLNIESINNSIMHIDFIVNKTIGIKEIQDKHLEDPTS